MKKHGFRSIFSLLLAVMMVCSMLPTAAFAEGDAEEQPVVVETYTVTYADGMGGAAFLEQKTDGLLYGDPTPAFAGEPALDGYTFTGWDQEIAATVTQSVTYTARWQEVQQEAQSDVQPDVQLEADGNGATVREQVVPGRSVLTVPSIPEPEITLTALNTGHKIDVRFTVLYVGDEFNIGYNYGSSEKTKFVCQYTTNHSDTAATNHTIAISDIKAAADRASVNSGYQIVGWSKEANANPTTWGFNLREPTACNKGTTIYLVAKNPNPTTKYTYTLNYDANGGTGAPGDDSWDTTDASIKYHYFTVTSAVPTRAGYTFKGWKGKANDGSDEIYTGGMTCAVSQYGNDVVKNGNTWTRTLYAVWEENRPSAAWNEISKALGTQVYVQCVSDTENHAKQGYELRCETSAVGRVRGGYACNVYVYAKGKPGLTSYVDEYNTTYPNTNHVLDDSDTGVRGFELRYDDGGDGWHISKGADLVPIVFNVKCETQNPPTDKPTAPGEDEVARLYRGAVTVKCTNESASHGSGSYDLTKDDITSIGAPGKDSNGMYSCQVIIASDRFVELFNGEKGVAHTPASDTRTATLYYIGNAWIAPSNDDGTIPIVFNVKCEEQQPEEPSEITDRDLEALLKGALKIECTVVGEHGKSYDVKKADVRSTNVSGYNAEITFDVTPYFGEFIGEFGEHSSAAGESLTKVITLKWVDGKWVATNTPIIHKVVCVPEIVPPTRPGAEDLANLKAPVDVTCTTKPETHAAVHFSLRGGTYTIGDVAGNETDGYTCDITVTADKYVARYNMDYGKHTLTGDNTKTLTLKYVEGRWAVDTPITFPVECETAPEKPTPPTDEIGGATVAVKCITGHGDLSWKIGSSTFTVGEVTGDDTTGYTCTVTVRAEVYVNAFNSDKKANGVKHTLADDAEKTFTMTYVNGAWTGPTNPAVTFEVKCETEQPEEPDAPDISTLQVNVHCKTLSDVHGDGWYYLPEGTTPERINGYTYQVAIPAKPYVDKYNETHPGHKLADEVSKTITITWDGDLMRWNYSTSVVTFDVKCKPDAPKAEDLLSVVIHCKSDVHNDGLYDLKDGNFTVGEVEGNEADGYTCKVTVEAAQYVNKYVGEMKANHDIVGEGTKTVMLRYESALERWTVDSTFVTFDVECIPAPNISMLQVQVHCVTPNSSHMDESYDLPEDTTLEYVDANTRKITVQAAPYVEQYGNGHELADGERESKTITATWNGVKWVFDATSVTFYVKCETQPEVPGDITDEDLAKLKVVIHCTTDGSHTDRTYDLIAGTYRPDYSNDGGFTCYIAVLAAPYVNKYISDTGTNHELVDPQKSSKTITLRWNTETKAWAADPNSVTFDVKCTTQEGPAQKYTVTYTDGVDGVEIFKDQVYADLTAGTATPKFNGTPTRVGYFFAGWNPAVADTVTGNATYTASWKVDSNNNGKPDDEETRCTVTYLDGANGKAFASQVYPGLLSGTATPKFNGTPVRSGYVFIGWSPVWSGTVTGNVTYTATWSTITGGLDKVPKTGDNGLTLALSALLLFSFCGAAACVVSTKKRG